MAKAFRLRSFKKIYIMPKVMEEWDRNPVKKWKNALICGGNDNEFSSKGFKG